ncbi:hypothetical protein BOTNAR_0589g00050 [Botryotinia narcissicola]|uniref:Uncharacterized protein n=1 Tax=Botryotinia narcissicola TaxID=278944 RepID=A0A4Z1HN94_9HELO|nr:hypothetical protein BOTNAR_0589g00050 [Botryotinia narcissicola]
MAITLQDECVAGRIVVAIYLLVLREASIDDRVVRRSCSTCGHLFALPSNIRNAMTTPKAARISRGSQPHLYDNHQLSWDETEEQEE